MHARSQQNPSQHSVDTCLLLCVQPLPLWQKAAAGLTAGGLGALVGSPADLTLIRMQADATLPLASRRNYKGVGDAMVRLTLLLALLSSDVPISMCPTDVVFCLGFLHRVLKLGPLGSQCFHLHGGLSSSLSAG